MTEDNTDIPQYHQLPLFEFDDANVKNQKHHTAREPAHASNFGKYIVYVDESGDRSLQSIDAQYPVFVLAFCVIHKRHYSEAIVPALEKFKFNHFGHDQVILHEHDILKQKGVFNSLIGVEKQTAFMEELSEIVGFSNFILISTVIDKQLLKKQGADSNAYHVALVHCMETLYEFLKEKNQHHKKTHVVVECRGKKEDAELELEFRRVCDGKNRLGSDLPFDILFSDKKAMSSGLQLADLVARPIGLNTLRPEQKNRAFEALKVKFYCDQGREGVMFMDTHADVYQRCEDSDSGIGGTYYAASQLWLKAAQAWRESGQSCHMVWHEEILKRHLNNGHAVWDQLVCNSQMLLEGESLRQLATAFQREIERVHTIQAERGFDYHRASAEAGLRSVADLLGDVSLFEWSFLNGGRSIDERQKEQIAKFCLAHNDGEAALRWVSDQWQWCEDQRLKLLDQTYHAMGQFSQLLALRREAYKADPSQYRLDDLLEVAPPIEHQRINAEAMDKAAESENITVAVNTLFALKSPESASAYVLKHPNRLIEVSAHTLADWGSSFEASGQCPAAVLCLRRLLLGILEAANTKLYPQGAHCYKVLHRLANTVESSTAFASTEDFDAELRANHGRKRSFWNLVK